MRFPLLMVALSVAQSFYSTRSQGATLLYSNDVLGEIEPCGCKTDPYGGMVRKSGLIEKLKASGEREFLQVDAGNLLFESEKLPDALIPQWKIQAQALLRAHSLLGPLVIAPGPKDFALGLKTLQEISGGQSLTWVSTNLRQNGKSVFPYESRVKLGPTWITILGYSSPLLNYGHGLKAEAALSDLKSAIEKAKNRKDRVLLLSHQGLEQDQALAREISGIDWIVGAHSQSFLSRPLEIAGTKIFQSSFRNQYVGVITLDDQGSIKSHELVGLEENLEKFALPSMKELVAKFKRDVAKINSEPTLKREEKSTALQYRGYSSCFECHEKPFDFWRATAHARALTPLKKQNQLQNLECLRCHSVGQGEPGGYRHLEDIAKIRVGSIERSWPISEVEEFHTHLSSRKSLDERVLLKRLGPKPLPLREHLGKVTTDLSAVQCENCHGPAGNHPFEGSLSLKVTQETCLKCHTTDRAPSWYKGGKVDPSLFAKKLKLVACPKDHGDQDPRN